MMIIIFYLHYQIGCKILIINHEAAEDIDAKSSIIPYKNQTNKL